MASNMKAYSIAFETINGQVSTQEIIPFLEQIEIILKDRPVKVIRRINGKLMRVHAYEWNSMNRDYLVVPLGKLKEKNKPYGSDPQTQKLVDIPQDMFDVNSLAYHKLYRIALISTNQYGPTDNDIEDYFNSFIPKNAQCKIKLRPIIRNIGLEKIRNAQEARSITISLNVSRPLDDFLKAQTQEDRNILQNLVGLMDFSKNTLESNTFNLTLGLGKKKRATLDIGSLMELLDSINLDSNCIKEITVNYRNHPDEKIDIAKLRESNTILRIPFQIAGTQLGAEYILNNMDEVLRNERTKYYSQVSAYFEDSIEIGEVYELEEDFDNQPVG